MVSTKPTNNSALDAAAKWVRIAGSAGAIAVPASGVKQLAANKVAASQLDLKRGLAIWV
jgi:hypothetical protein